MLWALSISISISDLLGARRVFETETARASVVDIMSL
jgi:hypothetical protein